MFNNLIESKPQKKGGLGGTFVSVALHAIIITLAVYVTAHAGEKIVEKSRQEDDVFLTALLDDLFASMRGDVDRERDDDRVQRDADESAAKTSLPLRLRLDQVVEHAPGIGMKFTSTVTYLGLNLRHVVLDGMQPTLRNHEGRISIYSHIVPGILAASANRLYHFFSTFDS